MVVLIKSMYAIFLSLSLGAHNVPEINVRNNNEVHIYIYVCMVYICIKERNILFLI
jgi:hypothetical protein